MLSDLEADVLFAVEGRPEFAGVWRLRPRGDSAPRVAVALVGLRGAGRLVVLPDARFIHWFEAGTPREPPETAVAIALSDEDRARAKRRADERLARTAEEPKPPPNPPRSARTVPALPERPLPPVPSLFEHGLDQWSAPLEPPNQLYEERPVVPRIRVRPDGLIETDPRDLDALVSVFHREDGSSLAAEAATETPSPDASQPGTNVMATEPPKPLRLLVVARSDTFVHRLRELFGEAADVTRVASGWDALDRVEEPFDRVLWAGDSWAPGEPTEAQFFRLLAGARPALARSTFFVVDEARRERAARETPRIASRLIGDGDGDLRRLIL